MATIEGEDTYKTSEKDFKEDTVMLKLYGVPFYLMCLCLYSKIAMDLTGTSFFTMPTMWALTMTIYYLWHVQAHHKLDFIPFNNVATKIHHDHHFVNFPPNYFWGSTSEVGLKWRKQSKNTYLVMFDSIFFFCIDFKEAITNLFYAISLDLVLLFCMRVILNLPWSVIFMGNLQSFIVLSIGNYLHNSFHIKSPWLEKFKLWRELRYLHYLHHCGDTKHNYSIFAFVFDKIFGTYKKNMRAVGTNTVKEE